jgi:primosomal protein N' (replication factor Y)
VLHRLGAGGAAGTRGPARYRLVCHHCGAEGPVPRACPDCGNVDLSPVGRGTQRLEEGLAELFPQARIVRVDRDVARRRDAARDAIDAAHAGEVDILVGTQMLAKGHDFRRLSVVAVLDVDAALYSSDFRAPERLFALLMQVSGRAGRSAQGARVIVQTRFPAHPVFAALGRHDYEGFADTMLAERRATRLPPFVFLALLRAEAKTLQVALEFLTVAAQIGRDTVAAARAMTGGPGEPQDADRADGLTVYDPVPMPMMRVAGRERAQLLVESDSRKALHAFVDAWLARLAEVKTPARWQLEIDPLEI